MILKVYKAYSNECLQLADVAVRLSDANIVERFQEITARKDAHLQGRDVISLPEACSLPLARVLQTLQKRSE